MFGIGWSPAHILLSLHGKFLIMQNLFFSWVLVLSLLCLVSACSSDSSMEVSSSDYVGFAGETMGTTYSIKLNGSQAEKIKKRVDSLLRAYNDEVSTYINDATISRFNQAEKSFSIRKSENPHFFRNLIQSYRLHYLTNGYFDPTVMPLVNCWGFGYMPRDTSQLGDSTDIKELMQSVGLNKLEWEERADSLWLEKPSPEMALDFSACAKGDGIDQIVRFLHENGYTDFMIEIGGEVYARGENPKGNPWTIGINRPDPNSGKTDFIARVQLVNRGLATSGNYRNFFEAGGEVFSHTINPKTGWIERNDLLSATVLAKDVLTADAWATALMAMGKQEAVEALEQSEEITGFLVYTEENKMQVYEATDFLSVKK